MRRDLRVRRHFKIRKHVIGTKECPRLAVFRSGQHIYAQVIDDATGKTITGISDLKLSKKGTKLEQAYEVGKKIAEIVVGKGINRVVFDRGGFLYHGRVANLAKGAREGGLQF